MANKETKKTFQNKKYKNTPLFSYYMTEESIKEALVLLKELETGKVRAPKLCEDCANSVFKDKCFFFWEHKSFCSQHTNKAIY